MNPLYEKSNQDALSVLGWTVAIIGGGFSGTMVAVQLVRKSLKLPQQLAPNPLKIVLIDRSPLPAKGLAYRTDCPHHLLNVPAQNMSALPDEPQHFLQWWQKKDTDASPLGFAPRALYGQYLGELLEEASHQAQNSPWLELNIIRDSVQGLKCDPPTLPSPAKGGGDLDPSLIGVSNTTKETLKHNGVVLELTSGQTVMAQQVVLAMGNDAPGNPPGLSGDVLKSPFYMDDPLAMIESAKIETGHGRESILKSIQPHETVLILGTGLTMVDKAIELVAQGHQGSIVACSRRGFLPLPHILPLTPLDWVPRGDPSHTTPLALFRQVRAKIKAVSSLTPILSLPPQRGGNFNLSTEIAWRRVIDSLRPHTARFWQQWTAGQKRSFLRHLRAYWDVHRHRTAPEIQARLQAMQDSGQLRVMGGRLQSCRVLSKNQKESPPPYPPPHRGEGTSKMENNFELRFQERKTRQAITLEVNRILNCTGASPPLRYSQDPFISQLLQQVVNADPLGLGFMANSEGALLNTAEEASSVFYTLGPLLKGMLWESIAVPELRGQADQLGEMLVRQLLDRKMDIFPIEETCSIVVDGEEMNRVAGS